METLLLLDASWRYIPAALLAVVGLLISLHGLSGTPATKRGLLRSHAGSLRRLEGWRRLLVGLTLIGLSAAWGWESQLLLFLSLGIAIVEIWEASFVISVAKHA